MRTLLYVSFIISFGLASLAQDIHFSQMRYSPLTVNPALAGAEKDLQAIVNYRNQWNSVASPYSTMAASFDMRFKENRSGNGFLAAGINFFNDVAGDVRMRTTNVNASLAYHIRIDRKSTIGAALQAGLGQRGISPQNGLWESQFDGSGFDQSISSGESFNELNFSHFDMGAGMVYHYSKNEGYMRGNDQFSLTAGFAAFHVNRPESSFIVGGGDDLAVRWSGFVHSLYGIRNTNWALMPAIYYNRQGPHQEVLAGSYVRVVVNEGSKVTGFIQELAISYGAFFRFGDAFVNKLMLEYDNYSLGFSYDFNVSSLTQASKGRGGVEFFLRYVLPSPISGGSRARIK